jgi:4-hydroxy-tetrahydrodipicolinate synthase
MIVTVSHYYTGIVTERAKAAQAMGADMVMMMPPYHGAGLRADDTGIFEHYRAVSDAISIPIMVQDAPISGVQLSVPLLAKMAKEIANVSYFKMEMPFAADKLAALIDAGGDDILGPWDGEEAATLFADLEAGCTATMTSALQCEHIRPIVTNYLNGEVDAAFKQWQYCLPLINHENRQCGLRATKTVMKEGSVIASDHVRHPQKPMSPRTRDRLLSLARDMDLISLKWGK